jgi:ABC-2 type transport system permease protein
MNDSATLALFRSEFIKLRSTRTALGLLIAAVVVSVVPAVLVMSLLKVSSLEDGGGAAAAVIGLSVVPILALVFGVLGMTNEYRHGTITYTYLDTPKRWIVIAVKLVCYAIVGAAIIALTGALVALAVYAIAGLRGVTLSTGAGTQLNGVITTTNVLLFIATVGLMTAFGVGLGALLRAQVPTVAGALVWALIIEPIIAGLKPGVGKFMPFTAFQQLNVGGRSDAADLGNLLSRPQAFLVSIAYIAAVSVAAVYLSMRRDVT